MRLTNSGVAGTNGVTVTTGNSGGYSGTAWTAVTGSPSYDPTSYFDTDYSYAFPTSGDAVTWTFDTSQTALYARFYWSTVADYPANTVKICSVKDTAGTEIASVYIQPDTLFGGGDVGMDFLGIPHASNEFSTWNSDQWWYAQISLNTGTGDVYAEFDDAGTGIVGSTSGATTTFPHAAASITFGYLSGSMGSGALLLDSFEANSTGLPRAASAPTPPPPSGNTTRLTRADTAAGTDVAARTLSGPTLLEGPRIRTDRNFQLRRGILIRP